MLSDASKTEHKPRGSSIWSWRRFRNRRRRELEFVRADGIRQTRIDHLIDVEWQLMLMERRGARDRDVTDTKRLRARALRELDKAPPAKSSGPSFAEYWNRPREAEA